MSLSDLVKGHLNSSLPASKAQALAHYAVWMKDPDLKGTESEDGEPEIAESEGS